MGRQWKPILLEERPTLVPNQNPASPAPTIHVRKKKKKSTVFQHKPTVWFCHTSRTIQYSNYCQLVEFYIEGEQDFPKEGNK
jgi:hypothetical protein